MTTPTKKLANTDGGKTARACDSCIKKRARWYCAADDAFLCQTCDCSVHSANPLARRHERVRLKMASYKSSDGAADGEVANSAPSWHHGFTRKARTPRHGKQYSTDQKVKDELAVRNPFCLVPEVGSDEANSHDENEAQLLYRVPIFDPFVAELCTPPSSMTSVEAAAAAAMESPNEVESKADKSIENNVFSDNNSEGFENLPEFLPSDMELAEFAANVESLLGRGLENECIDMKELGLIDCNEEDLREYSVGTGKVKMEEEESTEMATAATAKFKLEMDHMEMGREPFELNFDCDSAEALAEVKKKLEFDMNKDFIKNGGEFNGNNQVKKKILLSLDYEAVITAWASQKCPWTNGNKPEFDPVECWPDCMGALGMELHHGYGELGGFGIHPAMADGGREARVSRYREKRRTRLFSKKIRYEVRKLNAEKRPRMKGRFVKRTSFAAAPPSFPLQIK